MKVVGRKGKTKFDILAIEPMQHAMIEMRRGRPFMPKGVWRFKSFEEAEQWRIKMLAR